MKGKNDDQIKGEMESIKKLIIEKYKSVFNEIEFIDSFTEGAGKEIQLKGDAMGLWYLGQSLCKLAEADAVFFADGYENFRGCRLERECAREYGIQCLDVEVLRST